MHTEMGSLEPRLHVRKPLVVRTYWADRPLGVKLAALVAVGAVVLAVFAWIAVRSLQGAGDQATELMTTNESAGDALEADQMHDAIRGDVLRALVTESGPEYQDAVDSLAERSEDLPKVLAGLSGDDLGADVGAAVAEVMPAVDAYLASANQVVTLVGRDPEAARLAYPAFEQSFKALEAALPSVAAAVEDHAAEAVEESLTQRRAAITESIVVAVAGVLVLGLLGWGITRSVVGPLRRVGAVLNELADGDLRGTSGVVSKDEVGVSTLR